MLNDLLTFLAAKGDALAIGVLLGAAIACLWLVPSPNRLEKPGTEVSRALNSTRKSARTRVGGGR